MAPRSSDASIRLRLVRRKRASTLLKTMTTQNVAWLTISGGAPASDETAAVAAARHLAGAGVFDLPGGERQQFVVCGTETHVCVLQTVMGLLAAGREVFVVDEAVGSRRPRDKALGLGRMERAGAVIVSREMVAFEWLQRGGTDLFRDVNRDFIR